MKMRCNNKKYTQYKDYGGRGIRVCDEWSGANGFENFLRDMGPRPDKTTIDRIDNNGPYSPDNCRWATKEEQANNTRRTIRWAFNGETLTIKEWEKRTGIPKEVLYNRVYIYGFSIGKALSAPYAQRKKIKC